MNVGLQVSKDLTLPLESATWTYAVLAIKGAGKTYDSAVLAEEMVKAEIPIVVIDGLGIWWGITVGANGHKGLPVVVVGGQHKDVSLPLKQVDRIRQNVDEDKLRLMVKAVLDSHVSVVLDTSGLSKGIQRRIVATFVSELTRLNANYGTRHVFIEESDLWCPQRGLMGGGDLALSAGAIDDLVRRGGNFNLGCTLITQRSAVLNKDVLTQASCLIVLRILHKIDKDAVKTWVQSMADPKDPKIAKWYDNLRELKDGEAYVWHPEKPEIFRKVMFRKRETLHATREYFRELKREDVKPLDRTEFIEKFKGLFEPKVKPVEVKSFIQKPTDAPIAKLVAKSLLVPSEEVALTQQTPTILLIKQQPTIQIVNDPITPLGKAIVVLTNNKLNDWRWTAKKIRTLVREHAWDESGVDEAIDQLLRWEILRKQRNNYLYFNRGRIRVVEQESSVNVT